MGSGGKDVQLANSYDDLYDSSYASSYAGVS